MTRRAPNTELWAGGAAAGLLVLQVVVFGAGLWLSILLAVALYVGIVLTLPNASPANQPQDEEQVAFKAAVDHLGAIRRLETHVRGPDAHVQVQRIGDRVSQTLQVMREDGMLAAARPFNEHLLEPYVVLLNEYVRLASRDVKSAGELLKKAETHDFPIIEAAIDSFYEKLNRGNIVDLATQAEMLSLHIESLELSPHWRSRP